MYSICTFTISDFFYFLFIVYLDAGPASVTTIATVSNQVATGAAQRWRVRNIFLSK